MQELRTVRLYGKMGARFGRVHRLAVNSPAEAVQALATQIPGFEEYMYGAKERGFGFAVFNGKRNITKEEVGMPAGRETEIRIAPIIFGSKSGSIFQIIIGTILLVASFFVPVPGLSSALFNIGLSMIIGGVVQLLMPVPKTKKPYEDKDPNYSFAGAVNTTAQGHPVPLLYGRAKVGSAVISAGITLKDENIATTGDQPTDGQDIAEDLYEFFQRRGKDLDP